jgi:hypothetical protein
MPSWSLVLLLKLKTRKMKTRQLVLLIMMIGMVACTPKTEEAITDENGFVEQNIDPMKTEKVAEFDKNDKLKLDNRLAKNILQQRFPDVSNISDINLKQYKIFAPYYLIAKGEIDGESVLIAMELLRKGGEYHTSEYNTLHTTCTAKSCEMCSFRIDANGEIGDCDCGTETESSENSPCEHRMMIKTLEKEF